jgi:hypothetical protein
MLNIFTYYNPAGGDIEDDYRLLLLWKKNWEHFGYTPVVLSEFHARQHPLWNAFNSRIEKFPTINPIEYEKTCYHRYLAYRVAGGGLCSDWDLFAYVVRDLPKTPPEKLVSYQGHVPSLIHGSDHAFDEIIRGMMNYEVSQKDIDPNYNRPHVSDMHILLRGDLQYEKKQQVKNYTEPGWEKAKFVHYSTGTMAPNKRIPKHKFIQELRNWE